MTTSPDSVRYDTPGFGVLSGAPNRRPGGLVAPRRFRMTRGLSSGLAYRSSLAGTSPMTYMSVVPIEAPCYAVRLGFANVFNVDMNIDKASVYPSDTYSVLSANGNAALKSSAQAQWAPVPTGGAAGAPVYFDNAGADVGTINTSGSTRNFTIAADATNTANAAKAFTIQWSDFVPCTSIARADGGAQHLLFIYVTLSGTGFSSGNSKFYAMNSDPLAHRGRYTWTGLAWNQGTDYADNPTGTTFKDWTISPLICVQYLTANPGLQVVTSGDSLSAAPTNDNFSSPLWRAACDLSTLSAPVDVMSLAWGGQSSAVYDPTVRNNAAAIRPSVYAPQPLSRNDGSTSALMQTLIAKSLANSDLFRQAYGTVTLFNSPGCEPSFTGNNTAIAAFRDIRSRLSEISRLAGIPLIDAPAVIGDPASPWNYLPGYSDDNTHPNSAGTEPVVPMARAALRSLMF